MSCLDLFAGGARGWSTAAHALGLDTLGIELDPWACQSAKAAGHRTLRADVGDLDPLDFPCDGLVASAPCQAFSSAGKSQGHLDLPLIHDCLRDVCAGYGRRSRRALFIDQRSHPIIEPLRWVLALRPRWTAWEQVEPCLALWRWMAEALLAVGYSTWVGICNSADHGVPQTRRRAILMASLDRRVSRPPVTHADPRKSLSLLYESWVTMADALGWDEDAMIGHHAVGGERGIRPVRHPDCGNRAPRWAYDSPAPTVVTTRRCREGLTVGRQLPEGEGERIGGWGYDRRQVSGGGRPTRIIGGDEPAPTLGADGLAKGRDRWLYRNGNQPNTTERILDEPAPTIHFGHNLNCVEWVRERPAGESQFEREGVRVTLEEAAILQGIRPDYPFAGTRTKRFEQIGNAMPPPLARAVLEAVR